MYDYLSIFSYFLFDNKVFLYFGGVMLFFGLYFASIDAVYEFLFFKGLWPYWVTVMILSICGILLFLYLFVSSYLDLPGRVPGHSRAYLWLTVLVLATQAGMYFYRDSSLTFALPLWTNILIGLLIIYTFYIIVLLTVRGYQSARVLTYAITILFVGSLITIGDLVGLLPTSSLGRNAFQVATVFFAGIIFRELFVGFADLRKQKDALTETDKLKTTFFANITHEFRTPLTLMLGPLRQVMEQTEKPDDLALLRVAELNAERQLELVDQLLDLAQLDAQSLRLQAAPADFEQYLRRMCSAYESLAKNQHIDLNFQSVTGPIVLFFDQNKTDRILYNLLSNAFKFTPRKGEIKVALTQDAGKVRVAVTDTGSGIDPELLPNVFDRFFLAGNSNTDTKGSGIGLALVREMVRLHHGEVSVASRVGEGTTFTITLPLGSDHLSADEIIAAPVPANEELKLVSKLVQDTERSILSPAEHHLADDKASLPHILLIEDNTEMRSFIAQMLTPVYRVTTAVDGVQGLNIALHDPPDLVISDLMMPKMDGYEVCRSLKTDLRTSHVPLILLTARASQDSRLAGLEEGADDYLTKPFDARELLTRAANLISSRRRLRESFAGSITVRPSEIAVTSLDKAFISSAMAHVEKYLAKPELSVDHLAEALSMSRSQLNRKLRALVNQSSNQFIQSVRLQRAAQLLRGDSSTAKEVAYSCGFSSPAYFARVFKAAYGVPPSQYEKT